MYSPGTATVLELNFSDYRLTDLGYPGLVHLRRENRSAIDPGPETRGLQSGISGHRLENSNSAVARVKHDFDSDWHLVVGVLNQDATRNINTQVNNLTSNAGAYTSSMGSTFAPRFVITSDTAYLDGNFDDPRHRARSDHRHRRLPCFLIFIDHNADRCATCSWARRPSTPAAVPLSCRGRGGPECEFRFFGYCISKA